MLQLDHGDNMKFSTKVDTDNASRTLDALMELIAELLPVDDATYPELARRDRSEAVAFCLRHSALHFSKTAGRLADYVEGADHGKYAEIETLEAIVAASLVNSLKLADEIGISGGDIIHQIEQKFARRTHEAI